MDAAVELNPEGGEWMSFLQAMRYSAPTREELLAAAGPVGSQFVAEALRPLPDGGWRLPFHPQDMLDSVEACRGDHWDAWLGSACPAVLVHGVRSTSLPQAQADAMVSRRPGTSYTPLDGDHFVPFTNPEGFQEAVAKFLATL